MPLNTADVPPPLGTRAQVAKRLGMAPHTLAIWAMKRFGPRPIKFGKTVRYDWAEVEAWISVHRPASPPLGALDALTREQLAAREAEASSPTLSELDRITIANRAAAEAMGVGRPESEA